MRLRERLGGDVRAHPFSVDLEAVERASDGGGRASGGGERRLERMPLGVPRAGRPLVLVDGRLIEHCDVRPNVLDACVCEHRGHRVVLVRHRRRRAAGPFCNLGHLGLGEEDDVGGDLPEGDRRTSECPSEVDDRRAHGVPGHGRLRQLELGGVETEQLHASVADRGERAAGAAELCR